MVIKTKKKEFLLISRLGLLANPEIEDEFNHLLPEKLSEEGLAQIIANLKKERSDEEIDLELSNVSNLVFCITENCNLRCSYCGYSGAYYGERTHSFKKISIEIVRQGIDLFFGYINSQSRTKKRNIIPIGFYGGEPLLEISLIKKSIDYAKRRADELELHNKFKFDFTVSTNGLLLTDKNVDFFVENDLAIAVSIDGPQETHDRFRITADKKGSWHLIMKNLKRMKNRYADFYKRRVTFLCTVHPLYDGRSIDEFFLSNQQYFDLSKITFSNLKTDSLNEAVVRLIEAEAKNYPDSRLMFEKNILNTFDINKFKLNILRPTSKLTGTCFPGGLKFFIGVNGDIHICESINPHFPIGNVFEGINHENIRHIIRTFNEGIMKKKCWECEVWFICTSCYAPSSYGEELRFHCPKEGIINGLIDYLCYKEDEYEKKQSDICINSVDDYLDFLQ